MYWSFNRTQVVNDVDTGELCITILVTKKIAEEKLDAKNILPKEIEKVKTDVANVSGEIKILS
ncbi:MAG: hypothetical protein ACR2LL_00185 [Nitrosopumilus sp.]